MNRAHTFKTTLLILGGLMLGLGAGTATAQDVSSIRLISAHADCTAGGAGATSLTVTIDGQTLSPDVPSTQGCTCGNTIIDHVFDNAAELANIDTQSCGNTLSVDFDPSNQNLLIGSLGLEIVSASGTKRINLIGDPNDTYACQAGYQRYAGPLQLVAGPDRDDDGILDCDDLDNDNDGVDDDLDNCPFIANAGQEDDNSDNVGDACEFGASTQVNAVPLDPFDRLRRHDIISGKPTTLKAACSDDFCAGASWEWNPGDGSAVIYGDVDELPSSTAQLDDPGYTPSYAIWTEHTYNCSPDDVFNAQITVTNGVDELTDTYRMVCRAETLPVEVNTAVDEGLWHMHRNQFPFDGTALGAANGDIPMSRWDYPQTNGQAATTVSAASVNAFEANGYREDGPADSPYTETVARGLRYVISHLATQDLVPQTVPAGRDDDPDTNGNGIGIYVLDNFRDAPYQGGMIMDAIIASGTPNAVATTGPASVVGETYGDIIQDMVDWYAMAQSDNAVHGGWQYSAFNNSSGANDNSTNGWAGIGLSAAEDIFGATVPQWVKDRNITSLEFSDNESDVSDVDGIHGYTSTGALWGPYSTTGAALVQMSMNGIDATTADTPDERWIRAENLFRRNWNNPATGNNFKNYYYGMFNFVKGVRTAKPEPVVIIGTEVGAADGGVGCGPNPGCAAGGPAPLDWYNDPTDGLARTIVDYVIPSGTNIGGCTDRPGNSHGSNQDDHNTPWCIQILTQTLFQAGPVARAVAAPNPGAINQDITLDGSDSFHQDPSRSLVQYEWDLDNDGTFDVTGVNATVSFPDLGSYPIVLRVTDNASPANSDTDVVIVQITVPPHAPTADAGGPYLACINEPITFDGSASFDVDEGLSQSGSPPFDTITAYNWDLNGDLVFDDLSGVSPSTTYTALGTYELGLRVTDNTAAAFPAAESPDLSNSDFTTVQVLPADDAFCAEEVECSEVSVRSKEKKNQLVWDPVQGVVSYNILRSTDGPDSGFSVIAANHQTTYATYLDDGLTNGVTYYYRVVGINAAGGEVCVSDTVEGTPTGRVRRR